jgi:hypothetical protein
MKNVFALKNLALILATAVVGQAHASTSGYCFSSLDRNNLGAQQREVVAALAPYSNGSITHKVWKSADGTAFQFKQPDKDPSATQVPHLKVVLKGLPESGVVNVAKTSGNSVDTIKKGLSMGVIEFEVQKLCMTSSNTFSVNLVGTGNTANMSAHINLTGVAGAMKASGSIGGEEIPNEIFSNR